MAKTRKEKAEFVKNFRSIQEELNSQHDEFRKKLINRLYELLSGYNRTFTFYYPCYIGNQEEPEAPIELEKIKATKDGDVMAFRICSDFDDEDGDNWENVDTFGTSDILFLYETILDGIQMKWQC